jgi:hypothetical protein
MRHLSSAKLLLAGTCTGAMLASVLALLLDASLASAVPSATLVPSLVNCAAAGSLIARCIAR